MGVLRQTVAELYDKAAEKLAAVFRKWDYGEVTVEYADAAEMEAA